MPWPSRLRRLISGTSGAHPTWTGRSGLARLYGLRSRRANRLMVCAATSAYSRGFSHLDRMLRSRFCDGSFELNKIMGALLVDLPGPAVAQYRGRRDVHPGQAWKSRAM